MSAGFEARFAGKSNAGLRAKIREIASDRTQCGAGIEWRIQCLARVVALTAFGRATLVRVAEDYRVALGGGTYVATCDCDSCTCDTRRSAVAT